MQSPEQEPRQRLLCKQTNHPESGLHWKERGKEGLTDGQRGGQSEGREGIEWKERGRELEMGGKDARKTGAEGGRERLERSALCFVFQSLSKWKNKMTNPPHTHTHTCAYIYYHKKYSSEEIRPPFILLSLSFQKQVSYFSSS